MSLDPIHREQLLAVYRDGLLNDTLPFWIRHGVDREFGGIITSLDRNGSILDTDKGIWQQGRFAWLMGELYNHVEPRSEWLESARSAIAFLDAHGHDPADGRMWFLVTREGQPLRKRRYAYAEAFAAIAYGEYHRATGDATYAEKARRCFDGFIKQGRDPVDPVPKWTGVRPMKGLGVPMITIGVARELRDSIGLPEADEWIDRSIAEIRDDFFHEERGAVLETVGPNGEFIDHFDGRTLNPGHAIEAAWFIMMEGRDRGNRDDIELGRRMLDAMWQRGWDREYGGVLYFVDIDNRPVQEYWHDMKFWWPQNDTIIATLLAYLLTGEPRYAEMHRQAHEWAYAHFPDEEHGEWYGYLHRDGSVSSQLKGNLWKGAFHLPRMQLTCWRILEE